MRFAEASRAGFRSILYILQRISALRLGLERNAQNIHALHRFNEKLAHGLRVFARALADYRVVDLEHYARAREFFRERRVEAEERNLRYVRGGALYRRVDGDAVYRARAALL